MPCLALYINWCSCEDREWVLCQAFFTEKCFVSLWWKNLSLQRQLQFSGLGALWDPSAHKLSRNLLFCDPVDCTCQAPVHGIFQARILEWVVIFSSRGSSQSKGSHPSLLHWQANSLPLCHVQALKITSGSIIPIPQPCPRLVGNRIQPAIFGLKNTYIILICTELEVLNQ